MGIIEQMKWAFDCQGIGTTEKAVLIALAFRANKDGQCWPSVRDLGAMVSLNPSSVSRAIHRLIEGGWIVRQRRFSRSNVYSLQYTHSAVIAERNNCTAPAQLLQRSASVIAEAQTEGPRNQPKNRPKKKRERFCPDLSKMEGTQQRRDSLAKWLDYKNQKGQGYVEIGWNALLAKLAAYTDHQISEAISEAIINNWQGFFPEKVKASAVYAPPPQYRRTENHRMPPEAFIPIDPMAERMAFLQRQEEETNGVHYIDR